MTTTYLSLEQTTARIAQRLLSTDQSRLAWASLAEADQLVCMERAQAALDDCHWKGGVYEEDQETAWPRVIEAASETCSLSRAFVDSDTVHSDGQVAYIPRAVKDAFAVQCAAEALRSIGLDASAHVEEAARMGVQVLSVGGQSEQINAAIATSPFARLCADAQRRMQHLRLVTTEAR